MSEKNVGNAPTKTNYELCCDCDIILVITCVLPMVELVQSLSKMVGGKVICVCDLSPQSSSL
jgi:hypothetical protein